MRRALLCLATLLPTTTLAAPPSVPHIFPAGGQRGSQVEILVGGAFERWPVKVWTDDKQLSATPGKDKGKFNIAVAADALPGTHWLRFHDEHGASALLPFVVGTVPELLEQEPNDDPHKPQVIAANPVTINGRLGKLGDVDCFAIKLRKGDNLVAALEANRVLGAPMDGVLQVLSAEGIVLDQNNDYHGLDPLLVFRAPAEGSYTIRVQGFPAVADAGIRFAGGEAFIYRLTLTTGGFIDHALPLAAARTAPGQADFAGWNIPDALRRVPVPADSARDTATVFHPQLAGSASVRLEPHAALLEIEPNNLPRPQSIALPCTISGRIEPRGDIDVFRFEAKKSQKLTFQVEARALGSLLDPVLQVRDAAGKVLGRFNDPSSSKDGSLAFTAPQDGKFVVEVTDLNGDGGPGFFYRLRALDPKPDFSVSLAADQFTLETGKPLKIPVKLDRLNGFDGDVEIIGVDLQARVMATPLTAKTGAKGEVTLILAAPAGALSGPLHISARSKGVQKSARAPLPLINGQTEHIWLSIVKPGTPKANPKPKKK